ncbi:hypothetical protein FBU30_000957 [Linnemannia zychae]|nr:hypothetical protein FBU30_000957 [Linnemannia zychae]
MRQNSCRFNSCKLGLLDHDKSTLTNSEKTHIRRKHTHKTHSVLLNGVMFRFSRDEANGNDYICICKKRLYGSYQGLENHVRGGKRGSYTQAPCQVIIDKSIEIAKSKNVCSDEKSPIQYYPAELFPGGEEARTKALQDESIDNDDNKDGNSDEDIS